jgi:hypothetical protein
MATMYPEFLTDLAVQLGYKPDPEDTPGADRYNAFAQLRAGDRLRGGSMFAPMATGYNDGGGEGLNGGYLPAAAAEPRYNVLYRADERSGQGALDWLRQRMGGNNLAQQDPTTVSTQYRLPYDPTELYRRDVANLATMPNGGYGADSILRQSNPLLSGTPF